MIQAERMIIFEMIQTYRNATAPHQVRIYRKLVAEYNQLTTELKGCTND